MTDTPILRHGWAGQLRAAIAELARTREGLCELAVGGTAVGTGLNAPPGFSRDVAARIAELIGKPFVTAPNKFMAQGSLDAVVCASAALRGVAVALIKIANDMRWLASGPRCGLGELRLPDNEPGSSIMLGKVNPTQCEATVMIGIQVIGEDAVPQPGCRETVRKLGLASQRRRSAPASVGPRASERSDHQVVSTEAQETRVG